MSAKSNRPVLLFLPTPPPYAGPEVASDLLLQALRGTPGAHIVHVRSNIRQDNREKGNFNLRGIVAFGRVYGRFLAALVRHRPRVVCFLLSSNRVGFLRDSVIVLTARLFGCRVIGHYRGANFDNFYRLSSPLLRWYVRRILSCLGGIIVQASGLKRMFAGLFPAEKMAVLPNGLDFTDWPAPERGDRERVRLLFIGHVTFAKGFYDLLLAYEQLGAKFPHLELWFAGETMDNERQKFRVAELLEPRHQECFFAHVREISDRINHFLAAPPNGAKYLGCIAGPQKRQAFEEADIFVLPSYTEGFSMAVLEAMAYGLPVVATRVGALQEILQDGRHGLLVEPGDPAALASALARLIEDRELRRTIGASNARRARTEYDIRRVGEQFLEILNGV